MTNLERKKFGRGPRELTGAVDLISHYRLSAHHDFFCKRMLPPSISDTHYLRNVVGESKIRKGDGMELDQLFQNAPNLRETAAQIRPFDLDTLGQAFRLQETAQKGVLTTSEKSEQSKDKEGKHKNDKDKEKKDKSHKDRHKDRSKDKIRENKKDKSRHRDSGGENLTKHRDKKRKHDGNGDLVDTHTHRNIK